MMKSKYLNLAVLGAFLVLVTNPAFAAIDVREIDICCHKEVLDGDDLQIIDNFVAEAVDELVKTEDFTLIARTRAVILSRSSSSEESAKAQYAEQFSESAHRYISEELKAAEKLTSEERRFKIVLNLLILVDSLGDPMLVDLAMNLLNNSNKAIQYWAVHSVTNPGITELYNSGGADNLTLAKEITEQLKGLVENGSPEILALMAEFAAKVNIPQGEELLLQIADTRIKRYADWTVEYELLDGAILKLLDSKIPSEDVDKPAVARRFGQLYSYAIQRYVKGRDVLSDTQKQQLASVLVETEILCIGKRLRMAQSVIKNAIEQDNYTALLQEHSRLLGDETEAGQLPLKLGFDYGKKPNGKSRTAPLALSEPPERQVIDS